TAETRIYWGANGFAFETPGKHVIEMRIVWGHGGVAYGVKASTEVWVNYPQSRGDNDAAATLLHPEVGMLVALGGGATHLNVAARRIEEAHETGGGAEGHPPACLRGYSGLIRPGRKKKEAAAHAHQADGRARHKPAKKSKT